MQEKLTAQPSSPAGRRDPQRRMGLGTAMALVIASMVGTGVFTTTGLLVEQIPSAPAVLLCWAVGGLAALCGALAYAELGAALPHNGGEYHFLSRLFHPCLGFLSAWVSLIVGFAAPLAAVALSFGSFAAEFFPAVPPRWSGAVLIVLLSALHMWRVSAGAGVQNLMTYGKVALILAFVIAGFAYGDPARLAPEPAFSMADSMTSSGFAIGLLLVSFSYFGWNAAAYVAGEVKDPARVMPRALLLGTAVVLVLYLALNAVFLAAAPVSELSGKVAVGHAAAVAMLGPSGGRLLSAVIALSLVSTVGALIVTGSRVYEAVGADLPRLRWLARRGKRGGPGRAILLQSALALAMLVTASFGALLTYIGFTLSIFAAITVSGVFVLRNRADIRQRYRTPGYPVTPVLFLALMGWMVVQAVVQRPATAAVGAATVLVGLVVYGLTGGPRPKATAHSGGSPNVPGDDPAGE